MKEDYRKPSEISFVLFMKHIPNLYHRIHLHGGKQAKDLIYAKQELKLHTQYSHLFSSWDPFWYLQICNWMTHILNVHTTTTWMKKKRKKNVLFCYYI